MAQKQQPTSTKPLDIHNMGLIQSLRGSLGRGLEQVGAAIRGQFYGDQGRDFFGPGTPLEAVAPEARGRRLDYPVNYNIRITPKDEGVTYAELRALADGCEILRSIIETFKDKLVTLPFNFKPKDEKQKPDKRCQLLKDFFELPDFDTPFQSWMRMIVEDLIVVDTVAFFPVKGAENRVEIINPDTFKKFLDFQGRTPRPPAPAYLQVIKGVQSVWYTSDELILRHRNVRSGRIFGFSPVEQCQLMINAAIRRALHVINEYTEGNTPEGIYTLPESWTIDQVREFQSYWNSKLVDNLAERRRIQFIPGDAGSKFVATKEALMKNEWDEWIARFFCHVMNISPEPFVSQMNRATADKAQDREKEQGVAPWASFLKTLMDGLVVQLWGWKDIEFSWGSMEKKDELQSAQAAKIYVDSGIKSRDEIRDKEGMDPIGVGPAVTTAMGIVLIGDDAPEPVAPAPAPEPVKPEGAAPAPKPAEPEKSEKAAGKKKSY